MLAPFARTVGCVVLCAIAVGVSVGRATEPSESPTEDFFGHKVRGHRVIFVLDHSKSMLSQLGGETRIERLRDEMDRFFEQADGEQYFDIHCFNDRLFTFRRRLVHNIPDEVRQAQSFLKMQPARGKTATYDALKSALIEGQAEFADRIIFLTDGHPTTGTIVNPYAILEKLRVQNRNTRIPIDVLAYDTFAHPERRAFLEKLASDHGGEFVALDD